MASKPKKKKNSKKPTYSDTLEKKQNWLKKESQYNSDHKKAIQQWEANKKRSKALDKLIQGKK
jgi:hypothetical protein